MNTTEGSLYDQLYLTIRYGQWDIHVALITKLP
jgi:hypothetical protein